MQETILKTINKKTMKQQKHNDLHLIKNAAQILDKLNHKNYPEIATDLVNLVRSYSTGEQFEQTS